MDKLGDINWSIKVIVTSQAIYFSLVKYMQKPCVKALCEISSAVFNSF